MKNAERVYNLTEQELKEYERYIRKDQTKRIKRKIQEEKEQKREERTIHAVIIIAMLAILVLIYFAPEQQHELTPDEERVRQEVLMQEKLKKGGINGMRDM